MLLLKRVGFNCKFTNIFEGDFKLDWDTHLSLKYFPENALDIKILTNHANCL